MRNSGEIFESYVQYVYQTLVGAQGKNIVVSRGATVFDSRGNSYNIDVFYEFDVAGVHHRVAIECKNTRRAVERDDAIAFVGKVRELPSTIGVFISRNGFQPAAKKYLEDHGILHYSGSDLPHFGRVLASRISPVVLPKESAVGEPFWTMMESDDNGESNGNWVLVPVERLGLQGAAQRCVFPLFYSRPNAELFRRSISVEWSGSSDSPTCTRGIEQATLRFLVAVANSEGYNFATFLPFLDNGIKFTCQEWTPKELAVTFSMRDVSFGL